MHEGKAVFSDECKEEIRERWPDICPECGFIAYIGMNQVSCVNVECRNGVQKERDDYDALVEADKQRSTPLSLLETRDTLPPALPSLGWRHTVAHDKPMKHTVGEWWYQLEPGEGQNVNIGDLYLSCVNGADYVVASVDRCTDVISLRLN